MPVLVFLAACAVDCISGLKLPKPDKLQVNIVDGEVTVLWDKPVDAPSDIQYNVQFGKYTGGYTLVDGCTNITKTFCGLSNLMEDYSLAYKARVQSVAGDFYSEWTTIKKFLPNSGDLGAPSFTLWATSTTLTVHVHQKPILKKLFPYGISYTIYLKEKAENKITTAYLKDDILDHQRTKTFSSLSWGKEYCVTIKLEGNGGLASSLSPQQCLELPEQEWFIIAVLSMSVLTVVAIMATFILCYVKRPVKTPAALKSPASGWLPLTVGEGPMEVVTDKGWFLSSVGTESKQGVSQELPTTRVTDEKSREEDRRSSTNSRVSIKSTPDANNNRRRGQTRQDDSGCGSIGEQDSVCSIYPVQGERSDTPSTQKTVDSGVGFGCHLDSIVLNLEEQDGGRDSPLSVHNHVHDNEDIFKEKPPELVSVVTGYRANTSSCTCSGGTLCVWCHNQGNYKGQYKGLLQTKCNVVNPYRKNKDYSTNAQMDIVIMDPLETCPNVTFVQLGEAFPMMTALSSLPQMEMPNFNMNTVSLSLCDVELNSD